LISLKKLKFDGGYSTAINAVLEIRQLPGGDLSTSNHPTALASQVAWITGESHISRQQFCNAFLHCKICPDFYNSHSA
jgi:hypothetical protein